MRFYKLVEKSASNVDRFKLTIEADSNDGDYVTEYEYYSKGEFEDLIDEIANLRDNFGEDQELVDYPNELDLPIPYNGFDGYCHTLVILRVEYIDSEGKIWDVEF